MNDHVLVMFDNSRDLGKWYDQKYTEMGSGWSIPKEEALRLIQWAGFSLNQKKLLDIGSGDGDFISHIYDNFDCTGIDLSEVGVNFANNKGLQAKFEVMDIEQNSFKDEEFDYLTSIGSIEHVIDLDHALAECHRIVKDGGLFLCMVPNELWLYMDQPQEQTHTDEEWSEYFKRAGFEVIKMVRRSDLTDFLLKK